MEATLKEVNALKSKYLKFVGQLEKMENNMVS